MFSFSSSDVNLFNNSLTRLYGCSDAVGNGTPTIYAYDNSKAKAFDNKKVFAY